MNPPASIRLVATLATLALTGLTAAHGEENTSSIKFSDPSKPGTLKIVLTRGDVRIQGGDVADIVIKSESEPQQQHRRPDGLRVLTESASYSLTEKNNVATLDAGSDGWMGGSSEFKITVPRTTNIVIANSLGGEFTCAGVRGDVEVKSMHGEVRLDDLVGSAVVDTMNGEITATVRELKEGKALSFTSMNGQVVVRVPGSAKANIRLRTQNGSILTDFDEKTLVTKVEKVAGSGRHHGQLLAPEVREAFREAARAGAIAAQHAAAAVREAAEAAREGVDDEKDNDSDVNEDAPHIPPIPPIPALPAIPTVTGGKLVTGVLNGGGPEISVTTMNGDVTLRQLEKK